MHANVVIDSIRIAQRGTAVEHVDRSEMWLLRDLVEGCTMIEVVVVYFHAEYPYVLLPRPSRSTDRRSAAGTAPATLAPAPPWPRSGVVSGKSTERTRLSQKLS